MYLSDENERLGQQYFGPPEIQRSLKRLPMNGIQSFDINRVLRLEKKRTRKNLLCFPYFTAKHLVFSNLLQLLSMHMLTLLACKIALQNNTYSSINILLYDIKKNIYFLPYKNNFKYKKKLHISLSDFNF